MKQSLGAALLAVAAAFVLFTFFAPKLANAGSASTPVNVSASVTQNCKISNTGNISFGSYDPVTVSAVTQSTGSVSVTCTKGASGITFTLSSGANSANATGPDTRAMKASGSSTYLSYDVYQTNAYATRFPTSAVAETVSGGITTPTTISLYGQIKAAAQDVSVDTYTDTLSATVNF